jgi:hypothetical protein
MGFSKDAEGGNSLPRTDHRGIERPRAANGPVSRSHLELAMRLSNDDEPIFWFSANSIPDGLEPQRNFLWAGNTPSFSCDTDTDDDWWDKFHDNVESDAEAWREVQDAMNDFACTMEIKSKGGTSWITVPPEQNNEGGHGTNIELKVGAAGAATVVRVAKRSDVRRGSGLRNETFCD